MSKKWKKQGKLEFFIFCRIFAPLEAKMMKNEKNDQTMIKNDTWND